MLKKVAALTSVVFLSSCTGSKVITYPGLQKEASAKVIFDFARTEGGPENEYGIFGTLYTKKGNPCEGPWEKLNDNRVQMLAYLPANEKLFVRVSLEQNEGAGLVKVSNSCDMISAIVLEEGRSYKIKSLMSTSMLGGLCSQSIREVELVENVESKISDMGFAGASASASYFIKSENSLVSPIERIKCQ